MRQTDRRHSLAAVLGAAAVLLHSLVPAPVRAQSSIPLNHGGVLLVHVEDEGGVSCDDFRLGSWDSAIVKVPADGREHRLSVYGAFPPEDSVLVAGISFGIRYSGGVEVVGHGICGGDGRAIPQKNWPSSGTGTAFVFNPAPETTLFGLCWFLVRSDGPGYFEVTPHPSPEHAGAFASIFNPEVRPPVHLEPIRAYGRVGFGFEGTLPEPGAEMPRGICCLDRCYEISPVDCTFYKGLYLGEGTDCESAPCGSNALPGGCCIDGECVSLSRYDCVKQEGSFLGESTPCTPTACEGEADRR